jgi:hypothetical protein
MSIASLYGMDGPRSNPGGNEIFRAVQTNAESHPPSYPMVTECFPGSERLEHGDGHPPPFSAVVRLGSSYISAMSWGELNLLDKSIFVKICLFLS